MSAKPRIVLAGASGFIGRAAAEAFAERYDVTVLTRSRARVEGAYGSRIAWRQCDLFKAAEVEEAATGGIGLRRCRGSALHASRSGDQGGEATQ